MKRRVLRIISLSCLLVILSLSLNSAIGLGLQQKVAWIPIQGTIDPGLAGFIKRGMDEAQKQGSDGIVLEIDTLGGRIDAALQIRDLILDAQIPVTAYVKNRAWSAGVLISIAADQIYMAPGSSIGAAEPRPAEEKIIAAWRKELETTAERRGRNELLVGAMADKDMSIEGLVKEGKLLSLTAKQAEKEGLIDGIAADNRSLLANIGMGGAHVEVIEPNMGEKIALFVTDPVVMPILLTLGLLGAVIEVFTFGFGIAGTISVLALGLFFGGNFIAGVTGWAALVLWAAGILLLILEVFVIPGFGFAGVSGIISIAFSIFLASSGNPDILRALVYAIIATVVIAFFLLRYVFKQRAWNKLILGTNQNKESGYVASTNLSQLKGKTGIALTVLRPAGIILIGDQKVDALSEGDYINANTPIKVVKVEGTAVYVRTEINKVEEEQ